jgi:hypothetical protein
MLPGQKETGRETGRMPENEPMIRDALLSRPNGSRQAAVVRAIFGVPRGLSAANPVRQDIQFLPGASRSVCRHEFVGHIGDKILIVPVFRNCFKNVSDLPHGKSSLPRTYFYEPVTLLR